MTAPSLAILAMPKPFVGHIGMIQRNAILSWTRLTPCPQIFLFGEEAGADQIASELGLQHLRDIQRNALGTPLLSDLLRRARELTTTRMLCYVNCDIILLQPFLDALAVVQKKFPQFLAVAHRWEIELTQPLAGIDDAPPLQLGMLPSGAPGHHTAIDVFAFTRDMYAEVPPLALGRAWFDQWLIKEALARRVPVVDLTRVARAIHQKHDYAHIAGGQRGAYGGDEARQNLEIYGGVPHAFTLLDATHELLPGGAIRRVRARREKFWVQQWLWRNLVLRTAPWRRRLGLSRSVNR